MGKSDMISESAFDINEARLAHLRWEMALEDLVNGGLKPLDGHENCPLGKWLYGVGGSQYGDNKTFLVLKVAHKQFHRLVTELIIRVKNGSTHNISECFSKVRHVSQHVLFLLTSIELMSNDIQIHDLISTASDLVQQRDHDGSNSANKPAISVSAARLIHLKWLNELQKILAGGRGKATVQNASNCALGLWLNKNMTTDQGRALGLDALDKAHRNFHQSVESTVLAQHKSDYPGADAAYNNAYDYSAEVIMQLTRLELILKEQTV